MFTPLAVLDTRRVAAHRIDCCCCLPRGCPCCPTADKETVSRALEAGEKDPNQMCCRPPAHKGGHIGRFLEHRHAPALTRLPVAITVISVFAGFCGICIWQTTLLSVEDTERKFIPDDSYLLSTINKLDTYYGSMGNSFDVMTLAGDYHGSQAALADIGPRLSALKYIVPLSSESFSSWAADFKAACAAGTVGMAVALDANGFVTDRAQYYTAVDTWLKGAGRGYTKDIKWVSDSDPQKGIAATKIAAELKSVTKKVGDRVLPDADLAIKAMDEVRAACDSWTDLPGGKAIPYSFQFTTWETFKIIAEQMYWSVAQCLIAVLVITLVTIAHPLTAGLASSAC
eukprot:SRR837773.8123.p1 GENE.SRR837773.8123~~SRR837773.8123.p1  ORF type:complete len:342 (-),score=87.69 SRR837773.8123:87-1112(-)